MGDKLEDNIRKNRNQLDQKEPRAGHFERFEEKLDAVREKAQTSIPIDQGALQVETSNIIPKSRMGTWWRVAASIAVIFMIGYLFFSENNGKAVAEKGLALKDISPELAEVESFYASQIEMMTQEAEPFTGDAAAYRENVTRHLEFLDVEYDTLKKDLATNYADERVINSMIQNYRMRLHILEQFLSHIKSSKQPTKKNNYEDIEI